MRRKKKEVQATASPWKVTCRFNVSRNPGEPVCWWEVFRERRAGAELAISIEYEEPRQRYRTAELARMRADMLNGYAADDRGPKDIRTGTCDV